MAVTPLYKFLKENGTSFFAFPGSQEDISASYQNQNYKMYFSKYTLLNFPKQQLVPGSTGSCNPVHWDFGDTAGLGYGFIESTSYTAPANFQDAVVESLRNYVANQEVTIRESRVNNTEFYYNPNELGTTSEKIFFKWCKKLGLIDFEPAIGGAVQYFDTLDEFKRNNENDDSYFPEYLWQERQTTSWSVSSWQVSTVPAGNIQANFDSITNFKEGDIITITDVVNTDITTDLGTQSNVRVVSVTNPPAGGQKVVLDVVASILSATASEGTAKAKLNYNRLVQYIGEVNGVSNVNESNKSYTEVYAHVPDHTGLTPDILFRTMVDSNYKPNMVFPIVPSQYQPEIVGAELFNSPIVSAPQNYPGSYFAQFDVNDFTYDLANGDSLRRSGDYFGVDGDITSPVVDGSTIDGISIDFNTSHYAKMNIPNRNLTNFDQFDALEVDNEPPLDFEFNAILWYYTTMDSTGTMSENLYGISFLDNPDNNPKESEVGIAFPKFNKLVANGDQDGTSYAFGLNINFNIVSDNPVEAYNPEAINSLFGMNLFNDAMEKLSSINDTFIQMIADNAALAQQVSGLQSLLYSQTDLNTINQRINNLTSLINLYQTSQITDSESISVSYNGQTSPPTIQLNTQDPSYVQLNSVVTSNMFNINGIIPYSVAVPINKNFLTYIVNDDQVSFDLANNDKLTIILDKDLYYKQKADFIITSSDLSTENKKLDIYMMSAADESSTPVETLLIGDIDLPVFFNNNTQQPNSAKTWDKFNFDIDFDQDITLKSNAILQLNIDTQFAIFTNSIKSGDSLILNNLFIGTTSVFNFSGQYVVDSVSTTQSQISLDISSNQTFVNYGASQSLPMTLHGSSITLLSNLPYISLNKGYKISVTRVDQDLVTLSDRYNIQIGNL